MKDQQEQYQQEAEALYPVDKKYHTITDECWIHAERSAYIKGRLKSAEEIKFLNECLSASIRSCNENSLRGDKVEAELEALKKDNEWISVKNRLPEKFVNVLAFCPEHGHPKRKFIGITCVDASGEFDRYLIGDGFTSGEWTHWRPLPQPPKQN